MGRNIELINNAINFEIIENKAYKPDFLFVYKAKLEH